MTDQDQFLTVIDRTEAERRFHAALQLGPLGTETVPLDEALGRVLAQDVVAWIDVPSFDRSNVDGFAVRAEDTYGASETEPRRLTLLDEVIATAVVPQSVVQSQQAISIATGGMLPRGANAVVMVEHADVVGRESMVRRAVSPGAHISYAGTDIASGETVIRRGTLLTSRETGVLAALGVDEATVWRKPRVAILSTGDEIIAPGAKMLPGLVYDSNARVLADAVRELGGDPVLLGIVADDATALRSKLREALASCDVVLLSGGTSKGAGDISYRVVSEFNDPGIVAHGVALKPGKPICLAVTQGKPVVILPGFPTSAVFTFHEFVAPVLRIFAGHKIEQRGTISAQLAVKVNSEIGRTEYVLVGLVRRGPNDTTLAAYPMGKGSGSVTAFSRADGFITIPRHQEIVEAGTTVDVQLLGRDVEPADFVVIGSHCVGLDYLLGRLQEQGFRTKFLAVGSTAGLDAARRGECDLAGIHLLDPTSGAYNVPFLSDDLRLLRGYGRLQGVVFRRGDKRFEGRTAQEAISQVKADADCLMVNRNAGSGTRILIDQLLAGACPLGYSVQAKSHHAVAAAVAQGRADWGVAIRSVADHQGLGFLPLQAEQFDFVVPLSRWETPALQAFRRLLDDAEVRKTLRSFGFSTDAAEGSPADLTRP
jgi:putative molybdopterin biosynthesis protein